MCSPPIEWIFVRLRLYSVLEYFVMGYFAEIDDHAVMWFNGECERPRVPDITLLTTLVLSSQLCRLEGSPLFSLS